MGRAPISTFFAVVLVSLALALSCAGLGTRTHAATRLTDDIPELIRMASAVAEVRVLNAVFQEQNAAGISFTVVTLKVNRVYKGELSAGAETTAQFFGGPDGTHQAVSAGQPQLSPGDRAILILTRSPDESANWRVLGGDVGQITLQGDGAGECVARRASGQFNYYVRDGASTTGYRRITCSVLGGGQMEELLSTIVRTGRPVLEQCESATPAPLWPAPAATTAPRRTAAANSHSTSLLTKLVFVFVLTTVAWLISCRASSSCTRHY